MPILKEKAPSAMLGLFYFTSFQVLFIANLVYHLNEMHLRVLIRISIIILLSNVYLFSFSQITSLSWVKQLGNINAETSYCIATDKNGNVYTTGYFGSIVDFDPGPSTFTLQSAGNKDIFISKLNASGNFVWAKKIGSSTDDIGRSITVDSVGNVYVTGSFQNTVDFDPGLGTYTLTTPNSNEDIFILKLNSAGDFVWAGQQGGAAVDICYSIAVDINGYLYNTGSFASVADFDPGAGTYTLTTSSFVSDIFISKLDTSGKFMWAKRIGGSNPDISYSIALDKFGKPYCTGYFDGTVDFDPGPSVFNMTTPFNSPNVFVLKLDTAGSFKWAKNIGGSGVETAKSICLDNYGGVYTTGYFNGAVDFDPGVSSYIISNTGSWDAFVSKLDTNGVFRWATSFGAVNDQFGSSITSDVSGNVYSVGNFTDIVDFDPGPSTFTLNGMFQNIYISKLDSAGNFIFGKQLIGGWDANSVTVDSLNNIYLTGSFSNTTDFDPDPTTYTLAAMGSSDAYILKLGQCVIPPAPANTTTTSLTACEPGSFTLSAISTGTVNWFSSSTSTLILGSSSSYTTAALSAGSYTFYAEALTCTTSINRTPITLNVNSTPTINISGAAICNGESYTLTPFGASTYTFSSGNSIVTPTVTTVYSVSGTSSLGCVSSNTAISTVTVNPLPVISASTSNTLICGPPFQGSATLTATGANTYTWNPGGSGISIVVNPSVTATYTLTGADLNGCMNSIVITQSVSTCTGLYSQDKNNKILVYPNPYNSSFTIEIEEELHITITDILGKLIYSEQLSHGKYVFSNIEMSSGIYFLKVNSNEWSQTIKLIKQ